MMMNIMGFIEVNGNEALLKLGYEGGCITKLNW